MTRYIYKRHAIADLVPGMVLGKMVVAQDGKNFLNEGAILSFRVIQALQMWGFRFVEIREELPEVIPEEIREEIPEEILLGIQEDVSDSDPYELPEDVCVPLVAILQEEPSGRTQDEIKDRGDVPADFTAHYQGAVLIVKKHLARVRFIKEGFDVADVRQMVRECIMPLIADDNVMDRLQMMPHSEDYLYHHSVDVGIISGCMGLWLGRSVREIEEIVLGALLHDVGKALIPLKILNKPDELTQDEMHLARLHSLKGYKFLKQDKELSQRVLLCALQHHERVDGSGYPLSVKGDMIHPYAKIVAVADVFDAMTSDRSYARKATPYEAVEVLRYEMIGKLDALVCSVFVDKLCQRFVGDVVQLSNGQCGEVVFLNVVDNTRPMVRTSGGEFIDLDKNRTLSICKMLHS